MFGNNVVEIVIGAKDKFSKVFGKAQLSMKSLQASAIGLAAIGGTIALGFKGAIQTSINFESAFTGVRKTVNLTEAGFEDLENRFKSLSTTTSVSFVELSKIGELAGQLGIEGVDNLEKFTDTIARISVTTNLTAENAATSFARIANVMGEPIENVDKMGSVVVKLGNNFATTEAGIVQFAQRISGAAKIVGFSTSDVFAMGTALSSVGIQAEAGGTAVQTALLEINKAVATSSEELSIFAKTSGLSADEFAKMWEDDAMGAFRLFIEGLSEEGDNAQQVLDDVGLAGVRTARAFLSLAGAGDLLGNAVDTASQEFIDNNALMEESEKRFSDLKEQLIMVKNQFKLIGDEIGDRLTPYIRDYLLPVLKWLMEQWNKLSDDQKDMIIIFGLVTMAVIAAALALAALAFIGGTVLLVVAAIVAEIMWIITILKSWKDWLLFTVVVVNKVSSAIMMAFQKVVHFFEIAWAKIKNFFAKAWNGIVDGSFKAINKILTAILPLLNAFNKLSARFGGPTIDVGQIQSSLNKLKEGLSLGVVDIGEMKARQSVETTDLKSELDKASLEMFMMAKDKLYKEEEKKADDQGMSINIENIYGLDPQDTAEAFAEEINNKFSL